MEKRSAVDPSRTYDAAEPPAWICWSSRAPSSAAYSLPRVRLIIDFVVAFALAAVIAELVGTLWEQYLHPQNSISRLLLAFGPQAN